MRRRAIRVVTVGAVTAVTPTLSLAVIGLFGGRVANSQALAAFVWSLIVGILTAGATVIAEVTR